jgi:transposase
VVRGHELTDGQWQAVEPLLPVAGVKDRPRTDDRRLIDGMLFKARTEVPWPDLPERYGSTGPMPRPCSASHGIRPAGCVCTTFATPTATWLVDDGVPPNMEQRVRGSQRSSTTASLYTRRTDNSSRILDGDDSLEEQSDEDNPYDRTELVPTPASASAPAMLREPSRQ